MPSTPSTSSSKPKQKYVDTLDSLSKERYLSKISIVGGIDPYEVGKGDFDSNHAGLPAITYPDIVNYFVNTQSAYTLEELKAYKSLEAYNYFVCGWVTDVRHMTTNEHILIKAKVKHSQRLNDPALLPWVIAKKDGVILAGHCNCMAGLGEACSHIGGLVFSVEAAVKIRESKTVTQEKAYWLLPSGFSKINYSTIENIDFQSRQSLKRKLDESISNNTQLAQNNVQAAQKLPDVPSPTDAETSILLEKLHLTGDKASVLSIMPSYSKHYVPASLGEAYPQILTELYDESLIDIPSSDIVEHCINKFSDIKITSNQCTNVEIITREQSLSKEWFRFRAGRVTASRTKAVCSTKIDNPSQSLLKSICYPQNYKFRNAATDWGCEHESTALQQYCAFMKETHANFSCRKSGLVLNVNYPYMGASPDGIISCDCCGNGVVEIKCPYCTRQENITESLTTKSCLENIDGSLSLKKSHPYYYQVQTQLMLCEREFADFVVWTEVDLHTERIEPDEDVFSIINSKSKVFFTHVILPELVAKIYSRPQPGAVNIIQETTIMPSASSVEMAPTPSASVQNVQVQAPSTTAKKTPALPNPTQIICVCQQEYRADPARIVQCRNTECKYQWLHLKCINRKRMPSSKITWYCLECCKLPAFKKTKKK